MRNLTYYKIAIQNYYLIAQQDDAYAQYKTGIQYLRGEGIKRIAVSQPIGLINLHALGMELRNFSLQDRTTTDTALSKILS